MPGRLYVFSGPSGAGKSTIIKMLKDRVSGLGYSISHTSRSPRSNEINGTDYHFVSRETFGKLIEENFFAEWAEVYHDLYGTTFSGLKDLIGQDLDVVLDLDSQGAKNIKENFKETILIYILPPSLELLEKRLRERDMDEDGVIDARIQQATIELKECTTYDYIIVNDDLHRAVEEAVSIIISDRCSNARMLHKVKKMLKL